MTREQAVELVARAACKSSFFETGEGTCAVICMDQLGSPRKSGCHHCVRIYGRLAEAVITALASAGVIKLEE